MTADKNERVGSHAADALGERQHVVDFKRVHAGHAHNGGRRTPQIVLERPAVSEIGDLR
jgi:hypothetical protein